MSHSKYHRWPRPGEYNQSDDIVSYWPRVQGTVYCLAPALNVTWENTWDERNPLGTYRWSGRLQQNSGTQWNYGGFTFPDDPDYVLWPDNIQVFDTLHFWRWIVQARVIYGHATRTAYGTAGRTFWPVTRDPEPWATEIEVKLNKEFWPTRSISLWLRPSTIADMQPDSYDPLSTNGT